MTIIGCKITNIRAVQHICWYATAYSIADRSFILQNLEKIHMLLPYCLDYNCCGDLHFVYAWCHMLVSTLIKNRVGDDGVPAILQDRPFDLYLTDRKQTMAILQKDTCTSLHICR